jgi:hypothetical protein
VNGRNNQLPNPFALSGLGILLGHFLRALPWAFIFCPSGQMQAYRKDFSVPELAEGALPKQYIYTVAHASSSESSVLFPWLMLLLILISV